MKNEQIVNVKCQSKTSELKIFLILQLLSIRLNFKECWNLKSVLISFALGHYTKIVEHLYLEKKLHFSRLNDNES